MVGFDGSELDGVGQDEDDERDATERAEMLNGLHRLASFLERHPEVPLPLLDLTAWLHESDYDDPPAALATVVRALPKPLTKYASDYAFGVRASFGGVSLQILTQRAAVCKAIKVGTRRVPASKEYTVDVFEWECKPILGAILDG